MIRRSYSLAPPSADRQHPRFTAAGLAPYRGPWDRRRAAHLVRRTSFGAIKREVDRALSDGSATAAVGRLVETALSDPLPEAPSWYSRASSTGTQEIYDLQRTWLEAMRTLGQETQAALAQFLTPSQVEQYNESQPRFGRRGGDGGNRGGSDGASGGRRGRGD